MKMTRLAVASSCVLLFSAAAFAQTAAPPPVAASPAVQAPLRMAFVDLQRVAAESSAGKAANAKVQELTKKKSDDIGAKQKQLEAAQAKLQGTAVLSDAARATAQKDSERLTVEIDRMQQDAQAEVQEFQQQQLSDFQDKLRPVLDQLIKELGIGLLFNMSDAGAIYVDSNLDVTPEVIKRFDAASAAAPAAPAAAAPKPATPPAAAAPKPATPAPAAPAPKTTTPAAPKKP